MNAERPAPVRNVIDQDTYSKLRDYLCGLCQEASTVVRSITESSLNDVIAFDPRHAEKLATICRKTREDQFEILLVSCFGCGKSTTFNAMAGGRLISPIGRGIKTSGCIVRVQNLEDATAQEFAKVEWRDAAGLVAGFDTPGFREQLWHLCPARFPNRSYPNGLEMLQLDDPADLDLVKRAAEAEFVRHKAAPSSYDREQEGHIDVARIALLTTRFYGTAAWRALTTPRVWAPEEIGRLVAFPEDWESRWQDGDAEALFDLQEVAFLFLCTIRVHIHAAALGKLGCVVSDSPGLFASRWDTTVAEHAMEDADAVLYLLNGEKTVELSDLGAFRLLRDEGKAHKLILAQNTRQGHRDSARIRRETAAQLTKQGIPIQAEAIVLFHARDALIARKAERYLAGAPACNADVQALIRDIGCSQVRRYSEAPVGERPPVLEQLAADVVHHELELSGLPALEDSLAALVLEKKARSVLVEEGASAVMRVLMDLLGSINAAEAATAYKLDDLEREGKEAADRLAGFERDCGVILKELDNGEIDRQCAADWARLLSSRVDVISKECGKAIADKLRWQLIMKPATYKELVSNATADVVVKHVRTSLIEWATIIQDARSPAFKSYREDVLLAVDQSLRLKWKEVGKAFAPFDDIPLPPIPPVSSPAYMPQVEFGVLEFITRIGFGNWLRSAVEWATEHLPVWFQLPFVESWVKSVRQPLADCLERIGSRDNPDNADVKYIAEVRADYKRAFQLAVGEPRRIFEERHAAKNRSLALGNNKLRELVAHASSVRQRIASLQAKADAFRIDCEKALSQ